MLLMQGQRRFTPAVLRTYKLVRRSVFAPYVPPAGEAVDARTMFKGRNGEIGCVSTLGVVQLYNPYTDTWRGVGTVPAAFLDLREGEGYVVDDSNNLCRIDPTTINKWSLTTGTIQPSVTLTNNATPYYFHVMTRIANNSVYRTFLSVATGARTLVAQKIDLTTGAITAAVSLGSSWATTGNAPNRGTLCTMYNGKVWIGGGVNSSNGVHLTNAFYEPVTNTIAYLPSLPQRSYMASATSTFNGDIVVCGGYNTVNTPAYWVHRYDSVDGTWTTTDIVLPEESHPPAAVTTPTDQIMLGIAASARPLTVDPAAQLLSSFWDM